ncbi:hypothetical protein ROZALSC1DRAFT_27044 [Rozella allomycis CSF55]|uniref:Helicase, superfamily 1/2, ATP-binding domain-containing protein n=1 Tax=Rozella allomycis (strain CSF55) TaxID=988480 RepID=A0A075AWZ8_ROZAC|nr:Helicase, superfamily 1/2, ATP-binding domain-containing protein [Rozella allomycis CSF55]RKP21558.1 hypothetical protein ROZALSC1DRAFT_27044 [Rozella allomycis CSF55]|eukprot:EPZ34649.1 Helicase, superfamily 1/2, ATP-binding domain-containing protein [Rozella allomycis CSF55]
METSEPRPNIDSNSAEAISKVEIKREEDVPNAVEKIAQGGETDAFAEVKEEPVDVKIKMEENAEDGMQVESEERGEMSVDTEMASNEEERGSELDRDVKSENMEVEEVEEKKVGKKKTHAQNKAEDAMKRYRFLLGQTDIFKHFIDPEKLGIDMNELNVNKKRKTEKEEDKELMDQDEDGVITNLRESPRYVKGTMRDYQLQGLNWMISLYENGINGILADEMGLGKTLQSISMLGYLKHMRGIRGSHLVIVPKSTLQNWKNEFNKWVPDFDAFIFHGNQQERAELIGERIKTMDFEICITSFEICILEKSALKKITWEYIVIDEAHRIKNENSLLSQIVRLFECRNRLLLTGTPLQNNLHELWALLNFLLPDVFKSAEDFDLWFEKHGNDQEKMVIQLRKILEPFLMRRLKADVEHSLLPKKEVNLYVGMTEMQKKYYQKCLEKDIDAVNGGITGKRQNKNRLLNIVMQLRKCCNHPYLFDGAEPGPPYSTGEHLVYNSGKMIVLDKLLKKMRDNGSRVLIFSQMSRVLDILEDYCNYRGYECCRIDGQTPHEERIEAIEEYNKPNSSKFVFLLTTRAGGLGINLATADVVVLYDSDWNPQADLQAQDRAHRIGQTKQVYVFRFITENSIEEKIIERAIQKLRLDQLVIQNGKRDNLNQKLGQEDLLTMIRHGAQDAFIEGSTVIDEDIEIVLNKGEEKTRELMKKYETAGLEDLQKFNVDNSFNTYEWDGKDFSKKKNKSLFILETSKRERKSNYAIDSYYRDTLGIQITRGPSSKAPRAPKQPAIYDYQFYPLRLIELFTKENLYYRKSVDYKVVQRKPEKNETLEQVELQAIQEQEKIDNAEPLNEEEEIEKDKLIHLGYGNWTRKDFQQFIKGCEKFGRNNFVEIEKEVETKSLDEIKDYSKVFWSRITELSDHEKIVSSIEKGELKLKKIQEIQSLIDNKITSVKKPLQDLSLSNCKSKSFSEIEDRFLLLKIHQIGYSTDDLYEKIRFEIKNSHLFKFNWFFRSRNANELMKRCQTLIASLQKESEIEERKKRKSIQQSTKPKKSKNE